MSGRTARECRLEEGQKKDNDVVRTSKSFRAERASDCRDW